MAFTLSPSVTVTERDFSGIVSLVATTPAAFVGRFDKGPVNTRTLISSVKELQETFGTPSVNRYGVDWWTCFNFLQYGNNLTIVRVGGSGATSGNVGLSGGLDLEGSSNIFLFNSKDVGSQVNGALEIQIACAGLSYQAGTATDVFSYQPNTSSHAARFGATGDELSLAIIDRKGVYGSQNSVLELYEGMSQIINAVDDVGNALYYKYVLAESDFIEIDSSVGQFNSLFGGLSGGIGLSAEYMANDYLNGLDVTVSSADLDPNGDLIASKVNFAKRPLDAYGNTGNSGAYGPLTYLIVGGSFGAEVTSADVETAWTTYFADSDEVDVSLLIAGDASNELNQKVIDLANLRKDCMALISTPVGVSGSFGAAAPALINKATLPEIDYTTVLNYRKNTLNRDTSYAAMDGNWKYISDSYNGVSRWVPLNGDVAGLIARTETDFAAWFSPAGYARGNISNVIKLAFNPSKAQRDGLYSAGINNVFAFPGSGTVLWGDKTLQTKPSAFDRIQVRRLFNILEKSFATSANFVLFEQNDAFTRQNFIGQLEPVLREVQNGRGLENYRIVCDESNNPGNVVDRGEFVCDIYLQPTKSVQFIKLNFIANNSGSFFTEG
jgi:hypothetical protein